MKKRQLCYILSFLVIPALLSCAEFTAVGVPKEAETGKKVFVNQVGYLPDYFKRVVSAEEAGEFILLAEESKKEMYKGTLRPVYDRTSERVIWQGEFTSFVIPGRYRILVPGVGESYSFIIGPDVYNDPLKLGTRFLYLQRCGIELNDLETTGHYHPYCHLKDGFLARADQFYAANEKIFSVGGWHDAGDYGKYVSTTTVTAAQMLTDYELWPEKFYDGQFDIPEIGNGIQDLLDEARIGLEWLLPCSVRTAQSITSSPEAAGRRLTPLRILTGSHDTSMAYQLRIQRSLLPRWLLPPGSMRKLILFSPEKPWWLQRNLGSFCVRIRISSGIIPVSMMRGQAPMVPPLTDRIGCGQLLNWSPFSAEMIIWRK